jgi:hypothetical protein
VKEDIRKVRRAGHTRRREEKLGELRLVSMKSLDSYLNEVFLGLFE